MDGQKMSRTVKKKFLQIDEVGKLVKGIGSYVASVGAGLLIEKCTQNMVNPEESDSADEETEG